MKLIKIKLLILLCILIFNACEKIEIDNTDQNYPIELTLENSSNSSNQLSWTKTNISTFEAYIVVRSSTADIANLTEPNLISTSNIVATIEDPEENISQTVESDPSQCPLCVILEYIVEKVIW